MKNSLALVASMLRLQAREDRDHTFAERLEDATLRVGGHREGARTIESIDGH